VMRRRKEKFEFAWFGGDGGGSRGDFKVPSEREGPGHLIYGGRLRREGLRLPIGNERRGEKSSMKEEKNICTG